MDNEGKTLPRLYKWFNVSEEECALTELLLCFDPGGDGRAEEESGRPGVSTTEERCGQKGL